MEDNKALVIRADGTMVVIDMPAEDKLLEEMQSRVDGLIEAVRLETDVTMWVNEEGLIRGLPVNPLASALHGAVITGDVIITGTNDSGDTIGLPMKRLAQIVVNVVQPA